MALRASRTAPSIAAVASCFMTSMLARVSRLLLMLLVVGVTSGPHATKAATAAGPTCHGRTATIVGTASNDWIEGTHGPDVIVGGGGDDVIRGEGGNDLI